jgi:hypothetical protein
MTAARAGRLPRRSLLLAAAATALNACAALAGREPVRVDVVGVEPLPGQGMELRLALQLRVQNPNETPLVYDGMFAEIDVRGSRFASGVSDTRGEVPRFGEQVLVLPVTVPTAALLRQMLGLAGGSSDRLEFVLRGKLVGPAFGSTRFESSGVLDLPVRLIGP